VVVQVLAVLFLLNRFVFDNAIGDFLGGGFQADVPAIEQEIEALVDDQIGKKATADCPDEVDWEVGGTFLCVVEFPNNSLALKAVVTMQTDDGEYLMEVKR
jgi:hypothetical protein